MLLKWVQTVLLALISIPALALPGVQILINNKTGFGFNLDSAHVTNQWSTWCSPLANKVTLGVNKIGQLCADPQNPGIIYGTFVYYIHPDNSPDIARCIYVIQCQTQDINNYGLICTYGLAGQAADISTGKYHVSCNTSIVENPSPDNNYVGKVQFDLVQITSAQENK